jgi:hypothetical protein
MRQSGETASGRGKGLLDQPNGRPARKRHRGPWPTVWICRHLRPCERSGAFASSQQHIPGRGLPWPGRRRARVVWASPADPVVLEAMRERLPTPAPPLRKRVELRGFDSLWKLSCQGVAVSALTGICLWLLGMAGWPVGECRAGGDQRGCQVAALTSLLRGRDDRGRGGSPRLSGLVRAA